MDPAQKAVREKRSQKIDGDGINWLGSGEQEHRLLPVDESEDILGVMRAGSDFRRIAGCHKRAIIAPTETHEHPSYSWVDRERSVVAMVKKPATK